MNYSARPTSLPLRPGRVGSTDKSFRPLQLGRTSFIALKAGALFHPDSQSLIVADLHLGKASAFAAKGQMLPPYDGLKTLKFLTHTAFILRPSAIIALGDSFHDAEAVDRLTGEERAFNSALTQNHRWTWVTGNHDVTPPTDWQADIQDAVQLGEVTFRHEPSGMSENAFEVCGHFHPKARVQVRGSRTSRRCFVYDQHRAILPAFGAYTGGLNVLSDAIRGLFGGAFSCYLIGRDGLYHYPSTSLVTP